MNKSEAVRTTSASSADRAKRRMEKLTGETYEVKPFGRLFIVVASKGQVTFPAPSPREGFTARDFTACAGKATPHKIKGKW